MLTVTGLSGLNVLSVDVSINTSQGHTATVQAIGPRENLPATDTGISIFDGLQLVLACKVQSVSYDAGSAVAQITAIDNTTWESEYAPEITTDIRVDQTTDVVSMLSSMTGITVTGPSISCYGGGQQTMSPERAVSSVANAFGLLYEVPITTTKAYALYNGGLNELEGNNSPCLAVGQSDSYSDHISRIYVQREPAQTTKQLVTITNQGTGGTTNVRLKNPNAQYEEHEGVEYPIKFPEDYWIDPWSKHFCTITVPVSTSIYHTAYDCGEDGYTKIMNYQCNDKSREWRLALYTQDPGTDLSHPLVQPLARLAPGNSYTCTGTTKVKCMRVEMYQNGQITCPDCGGIQIKAYVWEGEDYDLPAWVRSFESGDDGRTDYNIISSPYYPSEASFVASGAGARIVKQDSTTYNLDVTKPGIVLDQNLRAGVGTYVNGTKYQTTAYNITYTSAGGVDQTTIRGEH